MSKYINQYDPGIHIPAITSYHVPRSYLEEMVHGKQITVLQAEGGMGKTVFLTAMAHHCPGICVWCDLEAAGNSFVGFAELLERAIRVREADFSFGLDQMEEQASVRELAFYLTKGINALTEEPVLLVFDNVQDFAYVDADQIFSAMFKGLNRNFRLMLATKGVFPVSMAMFQAKGTACVIDRNLLCFRHREISELLHKMTGISGQESLIEEILTYTEGWPLAVMLILMRLQQLGYPVLGNRMIRDGNKSISLNILLKDMHMYQYIANDVFGKMEQSLQQFLLVTSVLDYMEPSVCNYLTKQKNSHQILEFLASHNLFIHRINGAMEWYRYHSILQDFLRDRMSSEQRSSIQMRAAAYYMSVHNFEEGTAYAINARDPEIVIQALEQYGSELLSKERLDILGQWAELLTTTDWIGCIPQLSIRAGYLLSRYYLHCGNQKEAGVFLEKSCQKALAQKEKRFFSHYFYEFADDLEYIGSIPLRRDYLQIFMDAEVPAVNWVKDEYSRHLLKKWTEYSLCQNMTKPILSFYGQAMLDPAYRGSDMHAIHYYIIQILQEGLNQEELLVQARAVRNSSVVISDFGYYMYLRNAYREGMQDTALDIMKEITVQEKENCFHAMCRIYELVIRYRKGYEDAAFLRKTIPDICQILQEQNQTLPFLKPEDRKIIFRLLTEEGKREQKTQGRTPQPVADIHQEQSKQPTEILRVLCMDGMQVVTAEGRALVWRTKKAKELFFRLFSMLGKSCDKQTLIEDLWPDGDRDKVSGLFDTTLSYMKKGLRTLGAEGVLISRKRTYSLNMEMITSDLSELMDLLVRCEAQNWIPEESPSVIRKLYRKGLFKGEDYMWATLEQEYLERRVTNVLTSMAGHFYTAGNYANSIETVHLALEINPFNEPLIRLLLDSYISDGQIGKARKMQEYYSRLWAEELGESLDFTKMIS